MSESVSVATFDLSPKSLDEALRFADYLAESDLIPKDFKGKPGNCLVAIQWGLELGLKPLQAMQNIAVINGRPALWGDAVLALVLGSPACEYVHESVENGVATCRVKRRGAKEQVRTFSDADAKMAGLSGKQGPWTQYPMRMRQMRARAFALRDVFADVLKGMPVAEEVMDTPTEIDITPRATPAQIGAAAMPVAKDAADRTEELKKIIADLEETAKEDGLHGLEQHWKNVLTKQQRTLVGAVEWARIKALATKPEPEPLGDAESEFVAEMDAAAS